MQKQQVLFVYLLLQSESDNSEIINLIKLHVHVQLDHQLTTSTVSDFIIKNQLAERTFEQRLGRVKEELSTLGFKVSDRT